MRHFHTLAEIRGPNGKWGRVGYWTDDDCHEADHPPVDLRPPAHEWKELRATVFERDDYTCQYCGERGGKLECDHVMPVSRGGSNELENLATACKKCNRSKRAKTPDEWMGV